LAALKGRKGSKAMARLAVICRLRFRIVATRPISVLASFQGSVSARYLLPIRARFMASFWASLKRNTSNNEAMACFTSTNSLMVASS